MKAWKRYTVVYTLRNGERKREIAFGTNRNSVLESAILSADMLHAVEVVVRRIK